MTTNTSAYRPLAFALAPPRFERKIMNPQDRLYILMRSDMASMNAGKAMAQAAHASNAFVQHVKTTPHAHHHHFEDWEEQTEQNFGTTIVLACPDFTDLQSAVEECEEQGFICGLIVDPTYPLVDGDYVHHVMVETCGYVFIPANTEDQIVRTALAQFRLHP